MTPPLRHGRPWGRPATRPPDLELAGGDAALAEAATRHRGSTVRFRPAPGSDIARALGLLPNPSGNTEVGLDALAVSSTDAPRTTTAINMVVVGAPPDRPRWGSRAATVAVTVDGRRWFTGRATTIVVASGQFLRGADVVPRGHPGDGWAEIQVYALHRGERRAMRRRLATSSHVPHPRIRGGRGREVAIEVAGRALPVEVDGSAWGRTTRLGVALVPDAIRVLV